MLYRYDPNSNIVTTIGLASFNGAKAPNIWTGAVATDDLNYFYAFTIGGDTIPIAMAIMIYLIKSVCIALIC